MTLVRPRASIAKATVAHRAALYDRCSAAAFSLCVAIVRDEQVAADIVYDCFSAASDGDGCGWVLGEVRLRAISAVRASRAPGHEGDLIAASHRLRAFGMLDYEQRLVVGLVYYEGLTVAGVSRRFAISPQRVSRVLTAALELMRAASIAVVTAGRAVEAASLERHRRSLEVALEQTPRVLCVDFTDTRLFDADGARFLAETAICCDCLGVELRVLESASVTLTLQELGLTSHDSLVARARTEAASHPTRSSGYAFAHTLPSMTADQLESARLVCLAHDVPTTCRQQSEARLAAIVGELCRRLPTTSPPTAQLTSRPSFPQRSRHQPSTASGD